MRTRKGQSTLEQSTLIIIIIGALLAAGVYFKRGVQGRWKSSADDLGDQYDPRYTNTSIIQNIESRTDMMLKAVSAQGGGFWTMRTDKTYSTETKTGSSAIGAPIP
jgi:hypothetical protein